MLVNVTELKAKLVEEVCDYLYDENWSYSENAVEYIIDKWWEAKYELITFLSKHPKWNWETLSIEVNAAYTRIFSKDALHEFTSWLMETYRRMNDLRFWDSVPDEMADIIRLLYVIINDVFLSENNAEDIAKLNSINDKFSIRTNGKSSKVVGKVCRVMGWDKYDGYCAQYAKLCDAINPLKLKRNTYFSVHPLAYLTMSEGESWSSCLATYDDYEGYGTPGAGGYCAGTLSYMLDGTSLIYYTLNTNDEIKEHYRKPFFTRQVVAYNNGTIFNSRLYPQGNDSNTGNAYEEVRKVTQTVFAECEGKPNYYVTKFSPQSDGGEKRELIYDLVAWGYGAIGYPDWRYGFPASISYHKGEEPTSMVVGATPICIECGCEFSDSETINCCSPKNLVECYECGDRINREDAYYIDGEWYCSDCVTCCEECNEYVPINNTTYTGYGTYVCERCLDWDYTLCEDGEYYRNDDVIETEEGSYWYVEHTDEYFYCSHCDGYHDASEMSTETDTYGDPICIDCAEEMETEEEAM